MAKTDTTPSDDTGARLALESRQLANLEHHLQLYFSETVTTQFQDGSPQRDCGEMGVISLRCMDRAREEVT